VDSRELDGRFALRELAYHHHYKRLVAPAHSLLVSLIACLKPISRLISENLSLSETRILKRSPLSPYPLRILAAIDQPEVTRAGPRLFSTQHPEHELEELFELSVGQEPGVADTPDRALTWAAHEAASGLV
jgi:hypothetical protein